MNIKMSCFDKPSIIFGVHSNDLIGVYKNDKIILERLKKYSPEYLQKILNILKKINIIKEV